MHISNWLRRIGLLSITDKFRFFVQKKRRAESNRKFMDEHPQFPFPPPYFIYEAYQLDYQLYYHDGHGTAKEIIESVKKYSNSYTAPLQVLDWGCGPGRITRLSAGVASYPTHAMRADEILRQARAALARACAAEPDHGLGPVEVAKADI